VWLAYRLGENWEGVRHVLGDVGVVLVGLALIATVLLFRRLLHRGSAARG
jgi:hypothetical protein